MTARESAAMVEARKMVTEQGVTPYAAAQKVGLTRSAIYMAPWYKEWKSGSPVKTVAPSKRQLVGTQAERMSVAMRHAKNLITKCNHSVRDASDATGISRPAIYMAPWYKAWKATKK